MNNKTDVNEASQVKPDESMEENIDLRSYVYMILKYRWLILTFCTLCVLVTGIKSLISPKIYAATASIVPPVELTKNQYNLVNMLGSGTRALLGNAVVGTVDITDMYVGILESQAVRDAIIDRFDLIDVYQQDTRTMTVKKLNGNVSMDKTDGSILKITVKDEDPQRAAAMANAFVEELDIRNKQLSSAQARSKREFLDNRLKEIEGDLNKVDTLLSHEAKTKEMLFELLSREYELAKIEEAKSMPTIQVLDRACVPEVRLPRGTKRKAMLAGLLSFVFIVFVIFLKEYFAIGKQATRDRPTDDIDYGEERVDLEGKRMSVSALRKKTNQSPKAISKVQSV